VNTLRNGIASWHRTNVVTFGRVRSQATTMKSVGAVPGGLLWLVLLFILPVDRDPVSLVAPLLLFAILVLVPLILGHHVRSSPADSSVRFARAIHPFAAASAALSFLLEPGTWAGLFCGLWLLFALILATHAAGRLLERRSLAPVDELAMEIGMLYLPIGAAWLVAARLGISVFGFGGAIALLTALHFHYAGTIASTLTALCGRQMSSSPTRSLYRVAAPAVLAGPVLVSLGITLSPVVELGATTVLAGGIALLASAVLVGVVPNLPVLHVRLLISIWGVATTIAMVLAFLYAAAQLLEADFMNIPRMVMLHGVLNAAASLAGLIGWHLLYRDATSPEGGLESTGSDRILGGC